MLTSKETDPFELSRHVCSDTALDSERQNEAAWEVREQICEILQQLAPERAVIDDVKTRLWEVKAAQQRQILGQKYPAIIRHNNLHVHNYTAATGTCGHSWLSCLTRHAERLPYLQTVGSLISQTRLTSCDVTRRNVAADA